MTRYFLAALSRSPLELEVLDHAAVAVQQNERLALAALDVVQADSIDLEESTLGGIAALGILGKPSVDQGRDGEGRDADHRCGCVGVISEVRQLLACARPRRHQTALRVQYFHMPAPFGSGLNPMLRVCCDAISISNLRSPRWFLRGGGMCRSEVTVSLIRDRHPHGIGPPQPNPRPPAGLRRRTSAGMSEHQVAFSATFCRACWQSRTSLRAHSPA